jgi:hypothetical protein
MSEINLKIDERLGHFLSLFLSRDSAVSKLKQKQNIFSTALKKYYFLSLTCAVINVNNDIDNKRNIILFILPAVNQLNELTSPITFIFINLTTVFIVCYQVFIIFIIFCETLTILSTRQFELE